MELTWIDDFIALDQTRNFTKAADQRCSTQPAFSRRIMALEQWMGVQLFDRDARPVTLTKSGKECKKRIYRLREDIMDMRRIAQLAQSNLPDHAVSIYTTNTIAIGLLPQWLKDNDINHYRLVVSSVSHALATFQTGQCDMAILPFFGGDHEGEIIYQDRLIFMKGHDYTAQNNKINGNIVTYSPKTAYGEALYRSMMAHNIEMIGSPICESASAEAVLAQIRSGLGSGWVVESLLNNDDRQKIDTTIFDIPFNICVMKHTH